MRSRMLIYIAYTIIVLWAGFWTFFCVASAIGEREGLVGGLMHQVPAAVMIISGVVAWRWRTIGGALLMLEGGFIASGMWIRPSAAVFLTLGLPPLVSGLLLLVAGPSGSPGAARPASSTPTAEH